MATAARGALELDAALLSRLEVLSLVARKILSGARRADRPSARRGTSAEFVDHRPYVPGDDTRHVDWHLFSRLDELFLKLYREEEDLALTLLVDASASMAHRFPGAPGAGAGLDKLSYALLVAGALAYIGLSHLDAVNLVPFTDRLGEGRWRLRGRGQVRGLFAHLAALPGGGPSDLARALKEFVVREQRRGVVVVLSDFYDQDGFRAALKALKHRRHDIHAIHVVDEAEGDPPLRGDLRLVDPETGRERDLNLTDALRRRYRAAYAALLEGAERFCVQNEIGYTRASTALPFDQLVLRILRRGGLVA